MEKAARFSILLLLLRAATQSAQPLCRSSFEEYNGWCVHLNRTQTDLPSSLNECAKWKVDIPSIHSDEDLYFWANATVDYGIYHFWSGLVCDEDGLPYRWSDGTPLDYIPPISYTSASIFNCSWQIGFHLENVDVLSSYAISTNLSYNYSPAPTLCAYNAYGTDGTDAFSSISAEPTAAPLSTTSTLPLPPTSTTLPTPHPPPSTTPYCTCVPSSIWLDVVFIVDVSEDMGVNNVDDASATVQSVLFGLTLGLGKFQSRAAVIAFANQTQIVRDFGDLTSVNDILNLQLPYFGGKQTTMAGSINLATSLLSSEGRSFARSAIVLLSSSFDKSHGDDIKRAADVFEDDGGVFISIDFSPLGDASLRTLASPGYALPLNGTINVDEVLEALCDANCFCGDSLVAYSQDESREVPSGGCYHVSASPAVYAAANQSCANQKAFVATEEDRDKANFMLSLFPVKAPFWIGYTSDGKSFTWADNGTSTFSAWGSGQPNVAVGNCVYQKATSGFNYNWFSAACTDPINASFLYACQSRPCDSTYDCTV